MARRHPGIVTFGILGIVFGVLGAAYNGFLVVVLSALKRSPEQLNAETISTLEQVTMPMLLSIAVNALTGLTILVAGIGLLRLCGWARTAYLAAAGIAIANRLMTFPLYFRAPSLEAQEALSRSGAMFGDLSVILFNGIAIWWLSRAAVRAQFHRS